MQYPIDVKLFAESWCKAKGNYDQDDIEFAEALANCLNRAYYKGLEDGKAGATK